MSRKKSEIMPKSVKSRLPFFGVDFLGAFKDLLMALFKVRRICRTSIRAPSKLGPRQSIRLRENLQSSSGPGSGRSPRLGRRVNSLTNDDVISFTFSNYDADVDDNEKEHSSLK